MNAILNILKIPPDEGLTTLSGAVYGKFLIVSVLFICILWPIVGAMPAINAAWGLSFLVLVFYEWCFGKAVIRKQIYLEAWMVKLGCALYLLIMLPIPLLLSIAAVVKPENLAGVDLALWLGGNYIVMPQFMSWAIYAIRNIRNSEETGR